MRRLASSQLLLGRFGLDISILRGHSRRSGAQGHPSRRQDQLDLRLCDEAPRVARPHLGWQELAWPRQGTRLQQDDRQLATRQLETTSTAPIAPKAIKRNELNGKKNLFRRNCLFVCFMVFK